MVKGAEVELKFSIWVAPLQSKSFWADNIRFMSPAEAAADLRTAGFRRVLLPGGVAEVAPGLPPGSPPTDGRIPLDLAREIAAAM